MLHPGVCLTAHSAVQGVGIAASTLISEGSIVWQMDDNDTVYTLQEIMSWTPDAQTTFLRYAFQCSEESFALCHDIDKYTNHSCDPNMWWSSDGTLKLIARSDIQPGEEITYDYVTADILLDYRMDCTCGSASCRGVITNKDYLDPAWQQLYGLHLPPHVLSAVAKAQRTANRSLQPERA